MSWGPATVYIQRRLNEDGTSVDTTPLQEVPDEEFDEKYNEVSWGDEEGEEEADHASDEGEILDNLD